MVGTSMHSGAGKMATLLVAALALLAPHPGDVVAQTGIDRVAQIESLIDRWKPIDAPGLAIAVVKDGQVVYTGGRGGANLEHGVAIDESTVFHIASLSKQFTAFAIHHLQSEGKLHLDDDIKAYLPTFPDFGKRITIRHLLNHTSGLRDQWELLRIAGWRQDDVITLDHVTDMLQRQQDLNFAPGTDYLYSNSGYTLLAMIVEQVSGITFDNYLRINIFDPLGMTNTLVNVDHEEIIPNKASSYYQSEDRTIKNSRLSYSNIGATSMHSTAIDMAKWLQNFDAHWVGSKRLFNQMFESGTVIGGSKTGYGSGFHVDDYDGNRIVSHSGSDAGYKSYLAWYPEEKLGIVVLSNWKDFSPQTVASTVASLFISDDLLHALRGRQEATVTLDKDSLTDFVGYYQLQPGWILDITVDGDDLYTMATLERPFRMRAVSENRFFVPAYQDFIEFQRDQFGRVVQLKYKGILADKIARVEPSAAELERFAGEYYSPELATSYAMYVEDGVLKVKHQRNDEVVLMPTTFDQFYGDKWWFFGVQFTRDTRGEISGFELWGGRVRKLKFYKRSDGASLG